MSLRLVTLGCAVMEAQRKVKEEGGPNRGARVMEYLKNTDPPINTAAPWCAAFVQFCADTAAAALAIPNPLNEVKLEAYVQSYYQWAKNRGSIASELIAQPGDLVLYNFGAERWDHIGILLDAPSDGAFRAIEGNTNEEGSREGDGVLIRIRSTRKKYPVTFVRWAA